MSNSKSPEIYQLTDADRQIFWQSRVDGGDARFFTDFYLNGWLMDFQIDDPWQLDAHHATQSELIAIGGYGCGKTLGFAVSYLVRCATIPYYKFLNLAPVVWQSRQMFDPLRILLQNTKFNELFIEMGGKIREKPYPMIVIKNSYVGESTMEFMSADKQAAKIVSWEGDSAHIDECGMLDDLEETVRNLGSRLRGTVRHQDLFDEEKMVIRERESRMSYSSNSWENPYMWWIMDMAEKLPDDYWGKVLSTYDNKNLTDRQVRNFEKRFVSTEDDKERWLKGGRPKGMGDQFSDETIDACIDTQLDDIMADGITNKKEGFHHETAEKCGTVIWELPRDESRLYMVIGDPGQGNPPKRNAPCIGVFDYTDFPKGPAVLRAFWWGFGRGRYEPFVETMYRYGEKYLSTDMAFDSTGSQKMMDQLVFERDNMAVHALDMTAMKMTFNTALKLYFEKRLINIPSITGIRAQLVNYVLPDKKIAQDIVAMFQMAAGYLRKFYYEQRDEEDEEEDGAATSANSRYARQQGRRYGRRSNRS